MYFDKSSFMEELEMKAYSGAKGAQAVLDMIESGAFESLNAGIDSPLLVDFESAVLFEQAGATAMASHTATQNAVQVSTIKETLHKVEMDTSMAIHKLSIQLDARRKSGPSTCAQHPLLEADEQKHEDQNAASES